MSLSSTTTAAIVNAAIVNCSVAFDRRCSVVVGSIRFAIVFCLATASSSSLFAALWSTCFIVGSETWPDQHSTCYSRGLHTRVSSKPSSTDSSSPPKPHASTADSPSVVGSLHPQLCCSFDTDREVLV